MKCPFQECDTPFGPHSVRVEDMNPNVSLILSINERFLLSRKAHLEKIADELREETKFQCCGNGPKCVEGRSRAAKGGVMLSSDHGAQPSHGSVPATPSSSTKPAPSTTKSTAGASRRTRAARAATTPSSTEAKASQDPAAAREEAMRARDEAGRQSMEGLVPRLRQRVAALPADDARLSSASKVVTYAATMVQTLRLLDVTLKLPAGDLSPAVEDYVRLVLQASDVFDPALAGPAGPAVPPVTASAAAVPVVAPNGSSAAVASPGAAIPPDTTAPAATHTSTPAPTPTPALAPAPASGGTPSAE